MTDMLRVANCSGFYGDRLDAAREMVGDGPIDVLTGDYLAELTLTILARDRQKDPRLGWAKTFPRQLRDVAATCFERGIKIVVNAGGLNPAGCADACRAVYAELGLDTTVAHVEGDDLLGELDALQAAGERFEHLDRGVALDTLDAPILGANAYLGAWGIVEALRRGADLVICPRVTDASLVVGPAAWRFGWARDDWESPGLRGGRGALARMRSAGRRRQLRLLRSGRRPRAPRLPDRRDRRRWFVRRHQAPGHRGRVSIGTVTAQLLYEIDGPRYANPDVVARFDTACLADDGPDRVRVQGVVGEPPPTSTKVCLNYLGGYKNSVTFLLAGLDIDAKAELAERTLWRRLGGRDHFADSRVTLHRAATPAASHDAEFSLLTVAVQDRDPQRVGRRFSAAAVEMALASYPGFNLTAPPGDARPFGVYWPALVASERVPHRVVIDGTTIDIPPTEGVRRATAPADARLGEPARGSDRGRAARPDRRRSIGRQGRQRQPRRVGGDRRRLRVAGQLADGRATARADRRGARPADRSPCLSQPARLELRLARLPRRRRRRVARHRRPGQGPR